MEGGGGQPLVLKNITLGAQFSGTGAGKITRLENLRKDFGIESMIEKVALFVFGKGWMGLVANTWLYGDLIHRMGNLSGGRRIRQAVSFFVEISGFRQLCGGERNQLVRPFKIMVLQRRLVDLRSELNLV